MDGHDKPRGYASWLSEADTNRLHMLIREGERTREIMRRLDVSQGTVQRHRDLLKGKHRANKASYDDMTHGIMKGICRFGSCQRLGEGKPPYCEQHRPPPPAPIALPWCTKERLMARRA